MLRTQYQEGDCVTGEQIGREMKLVEISWDTAGEILSVKPNWVWLCFFYCWCYMMYIFFLEHLDKIHHTAVHSGEHRYQESTIKLYIYTHVCGCVLDVVLLLYNKNQDIIRVTVWFFFPVLTWAKPFKSPCLNFRERSMNNACYWDKQRYYHLFWDL